MGEDQAVGTHTSVVLHGARQAGPQRGQPVVLTFGMAGHVVAAASQQHHGMRQLQFCLVFA